MVPIEVVRVLSEGGVAGLAVVSEYLKRQLKREKEEIDSVRLGLTLISPFAVLTLALLTGPRPHHLVPLGVGQEAHRDA